MSKDKLFEWGENNLGYEFILKVEEHNYSYCFTVMNGGDVFEVHIDKDRIGA